MMMNTLLKRIEKNRKRHTRWLALVLCLSMIVSMGTFASLHLTGETKTYTKQVLECPYAEEGAEPVAHTHNDDCYDEEGNLVCLLPEIEAHTHTDECYTENSILECDLEETPGHVHSDECYTEKTELNCDIEENPGHQHTEECWTLEQGELICGNFEEDHEHTDECFAWEEVLSCQQEEGEGAHTHTDDCYKTELVLACNTEEGEGAHTHTDECWRTERELSCGMEELPVHIHNSDCIKTVDLTAEEIEERQETLDEEWYEEDLTDDLEPDEGQIPAEGQELNENEEFFEDQEPGEEQEPTEDQEPGEEQEPTEDQEPEKEQEPTEDQEPGKEQEPTEDREPGEEQEPTEGQEPGEEQEPTEGQESTAGQEPTEEPEPIPESDFSADLEAPEDWEKSFEDVELSGDWQKDLLMIAESQLGYQASQRNFDVVWDESGSLYSLKGWTRYGAWYGIPYGDWCAMFISFCLHYAEIPETAFPYDCATTTWVESLVEQNMYAEAADYMPKAGDLIFFDWEGDHRTDHVGIVYEVDEENGTLKTIEGNRTISVEIFSYMLNDGHIMGYGILPENPDYVPETQDGIEIEEADLTEKDEEEKKKDEDGKTEEEDTDAVEAEPVFPTPAQSFEKNVGGLLVKVEADEGAFPEGTVMSVSPVNGEMLRSSVSDVVDGEVLEVQAVDISFYTADGTEIEPSVPIRVMITPARSQHEDKNTQVVHIDDSGVASTVEQTADENAGNRDVVFDTDSFSIYAVVFTTEVYYRSYTGETFKIVLDYDENTGIPGGAELHVSEILPEDEEYSDYYTRAMQAVTGDEKALENSYARFFNIEIRSKGEKVEPTGNVAISISLEDAPEETEATPKVVHFAEEGTQLLEAEAEKNESGTDVISFTTDGFSVFSIVYTVDFEYSVNGKMYEFSIPGGGFITLHQLVEVLGIINEDTNGADIDMFIADIKNAESSDSSLIWVGKAEEDTTVGALKDGLGLVCEYSAELSEEQIDEINSAALPVGEWILISLKPFTTEETLTVTMKDGEVFTIKVKDAQEIEDSEKDTIDVNKSYLICYEVTNGTETIYYLLKNDGTVDSAHHPDFEGDTDAAHDFEHLNSTYTWTFNHVFKEQDVEHHLDKNYYLIRPIDNKSSTLTLNNPGEALVQSGNNNVAVIQSGDGFILEGYHNLGTADDPRYVHLGFNGSAFAGVDGDGVTVHIYEMDSLPTYDYTVRSADEIRGTVTVQGGTQQNVTEQGTVVAHYWDATSNHDKQNAGTITATPVVHMNGDQNKWEFDHWELDGLPLDRNQYGETISAESLPIPHNGSNLVAYFRQNPNYTVPPSEKEPSSIEDMTGWLEELQTRNIPLDGSATKKTAEVYDYQNRIYRVDFTSKANFETFAGNIDMAFCLDVSNSMYFPSALVETTSANRTNPMPIYQINNSDFYWSNQNWLDTSRNWNNPYYLVADASGTATVFRIYYKDGYWKAQDASRETESNKSFRIGVDEFETNYGESKNYPFSKGDNSDTTYMIFDAGDNGNNRFVYLNQSLSGSSTDLNTIANLLAVAGDASPGVKIAYNTFNGSLGNQRQDFQSASSGLTVDLAYASGGGTRPDEAFNDAQNFSWSADYTVEDGVLTATDRYVILVTDGAPQGGTAPSTGTVEDAVRTAATNLKTNSHVKFITVGLSMDNVSSGKRLLYDLADLDSNGNKMFYMAESGSDLENIFRQITKVLMEDAVVLGDITDTVGEGFYLVDKATGMPLEPGNTIDIEGNLTTDESRIAGVVQEDGRTIVWTDQSIDSAAGWHGTVYVKAQEELLGGNGMDTNDGTAEIVATKYRVGGKDVTFDTSVVRDTLNLTAELPSPKVNVNELTFFNSETEWTVYLGEEVDPKRQLKALYDSLVVEEVVNEDGSLHYTLSPNSIEERWDALTGTAATFSLPGLIEDLIREDPTLEAHYYEGSELNWDVFLEDILADGITLPYHEFGLADGSSVKITLEKTIAANEEADLIDESPHDTTVTGDEVEKYVLRIAYVPDYSVTPIGQGGQSTADFHTGTFGTMYQGHAAGRESSTNTHIINVYSVPLDVYKTDGTNQPLTGATFKLYKEDESGAAVAGLDSTKKYIEVAAATSGTDGIARLKHEGEDFGLVFGEKYYLIETEAPANYTKDSTVWEVEVQTEIGKFTDLEGNDIFSTTHPISDENPAVTDDMYPFNWDQGARVVLDGSQPVVVIAKGETDGTTTEITNGSFVSHNKAVSFRHTVKNLLDDLSITVNKTWEDENNPPESVTMKLYRVSEKGHVWGEGVVVPSTCTTAGNKQYTCSVCGETETHAISVAGHTPGAAHRENEQPATCTEAGGYDTVTRCTVCNAIIGDPVHTEIPAFGHDWSEWQVTTPAQPGVAGVETRVCSHDASHVETREIPALPNNTAITVRAYRDWYGNGRVESDITTQTIYPIGSTVTVTWISQDDFNTTAYINSIRQDSTTNGYWPGHDFTFTGGTTVQATRTGYSPYYYSITVQVTENMTIDLKSNRWDYYPQSISIQQLRAVAQNSLNGATPLSMLSTSTRKFSASLDQLALQDSYSNRDNEPSNTDPVQMYLDTVPETASCADGQDHTYKEYVDEYTITGSTWTLQIEDMPKCNEYGNPYTYYVVEDPALPGYETTYSGQEDGLEDSGEVTITNRKQLGSLKITKAVTVDGIVPTPDTAALTNGTYMFSIAGIAETTTADINHTVSITFASGRATSYQIDDGAAQSASGTDNTWSVIVPNLVPGDYTVTETNSGSMVLQTVTGGNSISGTVATVTVTDTDTTPSTNEAQVVFTNNIETVTVSIHKEWQHGENTNLPDSLEVHLSNGDSRTLNAENSWSATISGLQKNDPTTGNPINYSWTEDSLPSGYYLSNIQESTDTETGTIITTITNTFTDHYMPETTIHGVKIWDDGGDNNRPASITVNLYKDGGTTPYRTITVNKPTEETADPNRWPFEFTNLPIFNDDGSVAQYTVVEVLPADYVDNYAITTVFTQASYVAGQATGQIVNSGQGSQVFELCDGTDLGWIVIRHGNDFIVWTPRVATDTEKASIRTKVVSLSDQFNGINTATGNSMKYIHGVPMTIDVGNKYAVSVYMNGTKVMMKFLNPNAWSDFAYGTIPYTYTQTGGEGGGTITNKTNKITVIKEWRDSSGNTLDSIGGSISAVLKRTTSSENKPGIELTVAGTEGSQNIIYMPNTTVQNGAVSIYWKYKDSDQEEWPRLRTIKININNTGLINASSAGAVVKWDDEDQGIVCLTIQVSEDTSSLYIFANGPIDEHYFRIEDSSFSFPFTLSADNGWTHTWTIKNNSTTEPTNSVLPGKDEHGNEYHYYVVEDPGNYITTYQSGDSQETSDPAAVAAQSGEIVIINKLNEINITIIKVSADNVDTRLPNASFELTKVVSPTSVNLTSENFSRNGTTNGNGELSFTGLTPGYYYLKETQPPPGYVVLNDGWHFTVDENGIVQNSGDLDPNGEFRYTSEISITVTNTPGTELPMTGGIGTKLFTALGGVLSATAGAVLTLRLRKKNA